MKMLTYALNRPPKMRARVALMAVLAVAASGATTASGLTINLTFDTNANFTAAGLSAADIADMKAASAFAAAQLTSKLTDPINVNIKVKAVAGTGTLGQSNSFLRSVVSYDALWNAMQADVTTPDDETALGAGGSIPAADPISTTHTYLVTTAQAKALGIAPDDAAALDGTFTFGGGHAYTYDSNNRAVAGKFDYIGVALHEFTEIMGRIGLMGENLTGKPNYMQMDLFHFGGPGIRTLNNRGERSFSIDHGSTLLKAFNDAATNGGDLQDWASGTNDAGNAFSSPGVQNDFSDVDFRVMDVIGYDEGGSNPKPTISINNISFLEGTGGTKTVEFNVSLSAASEVSVKVDYATIAGTATGGSDFVANSGTLTFTPGTTTMPVDVVVKGDGAFEPDERFVVQLTSPKNATIAAAQGEATIRNDDVKPIIQFSASNFSVNEGASQIVVTLKRSANPAGRANIRYATVDGTAHAGADYQGRSGTLSFAPKELSKTLAIPILNDPTSEANEQFKVKLISTKSAAVGNRAVATVTINHNDGATTFGDEDASRSASPVATPQLENISAGAPE